MTYTIYTKQQAEIYKTLDHWAYNRTKVDMNPFNLHDAVENAYLHATEILDEENVLYEMDDEFEDWMCHWLDKRMSWITQKQ